VKFFEVRKAPQSIGGLMLTRPDLQMVVIQARTVIFGYNQIFAVIVQVVIWIPGGLMLMRPGVQVVAIKAPAL
jgi:hypothetical protein